MVALVDRVHPSKHHASRWLEPWQDVYVGILPVNGITNPGLQGL